MCIPAENPLMDPEVYEKAMEIQEMIIQGELVPPSSEETYQAFLEGL